MRTTAAAVVHDACDDRAPGSVLTEDPDRRFAACDQPDPPQEVSDLGAVAGEQRLVGNQVDRFPKPLTIESVRDLVDEPEQSLEIDRLIDVREHVGME